MQNRTSDKALPDRQLYKLEEGLHALITAAQAGKWDQVAAISEQLRPALEIPDSAPQSADHNPALQRRQIETTLDLLQQALQTCIVRMEQIQPLIIALDKISEAIPGDDRSR